MPYLNVTPEPSNAALSPRLLWAFFAIAFVLLFVGYGLRDPWPADEPRFVLVARQMVESGNWLFPHRGIELYPDKPPVYFWLLAISYLLIGSWRWSFLLPSLVSGMVVLWLLYDLGKRLWQPRVGLWAAGAVLASLQFVYQFKRAQIDPTLVLMSTASFYLIARHMLLTRDWRLLCGGFALAGLGVITKGVGFLPLLALLPLAIYRRGQFTPLTAAQAGDSWRWLGAMLCFLLPILLWLSAVAYVSLNSGNPEYLAYLNNILFKQTAERYANPWHHYEPLWYFAEVIALFWLPFSLAGFWLLKPWRAAFAERDLRVVFPLLWGVMIVLFFSASSGKRDMYILPALPAFALAAAPYLQSITARRGFRVALLMLVVTLGLGVLAIGITALSGHARFAESFIDARGLGAEVRWLWWMLLGCGGVSLIAAFWAGTQQVLKALVICLMALWFGYGLVAYPVLDASSSARQLMQRALAQAGPDVEIGLVAWKEQNLLQAYGRVTEFGFLQPETVQLARGMAWMQQRPHARMLMVYETKALSCIAYSAPGTISLDKANRRSWWLVTGPALTNCPDTTSLKVK